MPTLLDWPEESDESDSETTSPSRIVMTALAAAAAAAGRENELDLSQIGLELAEGSGASRFHTSNPRLQFHFTVFEKYKKIVKIILLNNFDKI